MAIERVAEIDDRVPIRRALVSVSDKRGLDRLMHQLVTNCGALEVYSTGGTYTALKDIARDLSGLTVTAVSDYTGQPEMRGGLVKTLDFRIYLGLLSETYNVDHQSDLTRLSAVPFDLTVVNLYPFTRTVATQGSDCEAARGNIDIGGPAMLRASAKNYLRVAVLANPDDYEALIEEVSTHAGATTLAFRRKMAAATFEATALYDRAIADYLVSRSDTEVSSPYATVHPEARA
ncbi:MAG: hypothetical protein EA403_12545 [Spirochaetaceae bacterium]|nr:MAG: hypothetical protein EA403_12545 [Spirochaetaceae bacterium]